MNSTFTLFQDYTFQTVTLGSALLGLISEVLGSFAILRKQSLLGDGISHSSLPGVVMAFVLLGSKNTEMLLLDAPVSGLLAALLIISIMRHTRVKFDSALALVMSVFFGLRLVLLIYMQKIPNSNQTGLKRFVFGQASTLLQRDIELVMICKLVLLALVLLFWKEFKPVTFDSDFAQNVGLSPKKLNLLLSFIIVLAIIIGSQTVGIILMSTTLITPAMATRRWTNRLWVMVTPSALFSAVSSVARTAASSLVPELPTDPAIVACVNVIVVVSMLFAPSRGILHRLYRRRKDRILYKLEGGMPNGSAT